MIGKYVTFFHVNGLVDGLCKGKVHNSEKIETTWKIELADRSVVYVLNSDILTFDDEPSMGFVVERNLEDEQFYSCIEEWDYADDPYGYDEGYNDEFYDNYDGFVDEL